MICYKDIQNLLMFYAYNLKLNSRICLSILYSLYSTNQKTSSSIIRNSITDIKCLNIAKISRNLPKSNMKQHVLYTYTRKCVEAKISFFEKSLRCAQKKHTANSIFAGCQLFAVGCVSWHTAKCVFAVCQTFAVSLFSWHTANRAFAVCPMFCPRQTLWQTHIFR